MQVVQRTSGLPELWGANRLSSDPLDAIFKPEEGFLWDYVSTLETPTAQHDERSTVTSAYPCADLMVEVSGQTPEPSKPSAIGQDMTKTQAKKLKEQAKNRRSAKQATVETRAGLVMCCSIFEALDLLLRTQRAFRERQKSKMQRFEQEVSALQDQLTQVRVLPHALNDWHTTR